MKLADHGQSRMRQVLFPNIHLIKVDSAVSLGHIGCGVWCRSGRDHDRIERQDGVGPQIALAALRSRKQS